MSIHRPDALNAINQQLLTELIRCVTEVNGTSSIRALIIRSDVPRAFSVGADLKERDEMTPGEARNFVSELRLCFQHLADLRVPTISCLHGAVLGGGLELALATDFRVASVRRRLLHQPDSPSTFLSSSSVDTRVIRSSPCASPLGAREPPACGADSLDRLKLGGSHEQPCFNSGREHTCDGGRPTKQVLRGYQSALHSTSAPNPENLPDEQTGTLTNGRNPSSSESEECWSSLVVGFPEASLGILPGAGGTQRLWRVIGFQKALFLTLTAARLRGVQVAEWGLVDLMAGFNEEKVNTLWQSKDRKAKETEVMEDFTAWVITEVQDTSRREDVQRRKPGESGTACLQLCNEGDRFVDGDEESHEVSRICNGTEAKAAAEGGRGSSRETAGHGKKRSMRMADDAVAWECRDAFRVGIELAYRLLQMGPLAVKAAKAAVKQGLDLSVENGLRCEAEAYDSILHTKDRREGLKAFKEKRSANFKGE